VSATGAELVEVERFDERSDEIWRNVSRHYGVIVRRDRAYLDWRFNGVFARRYRRFYLVQRGAPIGYAVLRDGQRHGLATGEIVDYLCSPRRLPALLTCCVHQLARAGAKMAYCLNQSVHAGWAFWVNGFLRRDSSWPLLVHTRNLAPRPAALLRDRHNWFITRGDSNLDRPRSRNTFQEPQEDDAPG
jgi:hypothetical protein